MGFTSIYAGELIYSSALLFTVISVGIISALNQNWKFINVGVSVCNSPSVQLFSKYWLLNIGC